MDTAELSDDYVASKKTQICQKPNCKSAFKISRKNFIRYNTRDGAIQAGKKPCTECDP